MKQRRFYSWMVLVVGLIFFFQTGVIAYQNVLPFADRFGRGQTVGTAAGGVWLNPVPDGIFAYVDQKQLYYLAYESTGQSPHFQTVQEYPLPDKSLQQASLVKIVSDGLLWITNQQLYISKRMRDEWGPIYPLGSAVTFDAVEQDGTLYLIVSDDRQLRLATWKGDQMSAWYPIRIQDVTHVQLQVQKDKVHIVSLADYGPSEKSVWWSEWDAVQAKLLRQWKLDSLREEAGKQMQAFMFGMDTQYAYLFAALQPGRWLVTVFPLDDMQQRATMELQADDLFLQTRETGELEAVVAAKDQVRLVRFQAGKKIADEQVSNGKIQARKPILLSGKKSTAEEPRLDLVAWLQAENPAGIQSGTSVRMVATTDDAKYREQTNQFFAADIWRAMAEVPAHWKGVLFALIAAVKWLVTPYLYLGIIRLLQRVRKAEKRVTKPWLHFAAGMGLYILSKGIWIDQFYFTETIQWMPDWMLAGGSRYGLLSAMAVISFFLADGWGEMKRLSKRIDGHPSSYLPWRLLTRFMGIDIFLTALWYGFFIR